MSIKNSIDTELPIPIEDGGTGKTTRQESIDTLTDVASAEIGQILTKDSLGNVSFQNNSTIQSYLTTGTSPNYQVNIDSIPTSYTNGMIISIRIHEDYTATGQATIDVNGMGAKAIRIRVNDGSGSRNIYGYEMLPNVACLLQYDGSQFNLLNPQGGFALDTSWKSFLTSGTVPNYTVTLTPSPSAYTDGMTFIIKPHDNQNESTPTLNVNGLGAKNLVFNTVSQLYATLRPYMLGMAGAYRVTFDADIDSFIVHNPTFGQEVNFTPTWGVIGGGPVTVNSVYESSYRWLNPKSVMVRTYCNLSLTSDTSGLSFALPFQADGDERFVTGSGYISSISGQTEYLILVYLYSDLQNFRLIPNDVGGTFPTDASFNVIANIIYNVDVSLL